MYPFHRYVFSGYYMPASMKTLELPDNVYDVGQYSVLSTEMQITSDKKRKCKEIYQEEIQKGPSL